MNRTSATRPIHQPGVADTAALANMTMNKHSIMEGACSATLRRTARELAASYSEPCDAGAATIALLWAALENECCKQGVKLENLLEVV